uniref:SAM domain-containing protein n=1 Tax=Caenorhabditis tropicalis TaxID=1561998 RepID=A0A1I7T6E7_9PELO
MATETEQREGDGADIEVIAQFPETPSNPPTPGPPCVLIPPGQTNDISAWKKVDVLRWISCFLPPNYYPKVFIALNRLDIDGEILRSIIERRPSHITFDVPEKEFNVIISYGEAILNNH